MDRSQRHPHSLTDLIELSLAHTDGDDIDTDGQHLLNEKPETLRGNTGDVQREREHAEDASEKDLGKKESGEEAEETSALGGVDGERLDDASNDGASKTKETDTKERRSEANEDDTDILNDGNVAHEDEDETDDNDNLDTFSVLDSVSVAHNADSWNVSASTIPTQEGMDEYSLENIQDWHIALERSKYYRSAHAQVDRVSPQHIPERLQAETRARDKLVYRGGNVDGGDDDEATLDFLNEAFMQVDARSHVVLEKTHDACDTFLPFPTKLSDTLKPIVQTVVKCVRGQYRDHVTVIEQLNDLIDVCSSVFGGGDLVNSTQCDDLQVLEPLGESIKIAAHKFASEQQVTMEQLSRNMSRALEELVSASNVDTSLIPMQLRGIPTVAKQLVEMIKSDISASNRLIDLCLDQAAKTKDSSVSAFAACQSAVQSQIGKYKDEFAAIHQHCENMRCQIDEKENAHVRTLRPMFDKALNFTTCAFEEYRQYVSKLQDIYDLPALRDVLQTLAADLKTLSSDKDGDTADALASACKALLKAHRSVAETMQDVCADISNPHQFTGHHALLQRIQHYDAETLQTLYKASKAKECKLQTELAAVKDDLTGPSADLPRSSNTDLYDQQVAVYEQRAKQEMQKADLLRKLSNAHRACAYLGAAARAKAKGEYLRQVAPWHEKLQLLKRGIDTTVVRDASVRARSYGARDVLSTLAQEKYTHYEHKVDKYNADAFNTCRSSVHGAIVSRLRNIVKLVDQAERSATEVVQTLTSTVMSFEQFKKLLNEAGGTNLPEVNTAGLREAVSLYCQSRSDLSLVVAQCIVSAWAYSVFTVLVNMLKACRHVQRLRQECLDVLAPLRNWRSITSA